MKEDQAVYIKNKSFFNSIDETFLKISSLQKVVGKYEFKKF